MRKSALVVLLLTVALSSCAVPRAKPPVIDTSLEAQERAKQEELLNQEQLFLTARLVDVANKLKASSPELEQFGVNLRPESIINALADGDTAYVYAGMARFCRTDDELALVLGHEMAHNAMLHIEARKKNAAGGMIADIIVSAMLGVSTGGLFQNIAALAHSPEFEQEADYVGLYYVARAGYDIEHAADFWRRMAIQEPRAMQGSLTHPSAPARFVALESARDEIKAKIADGRPLVPEMKEAAAVVKRAEDSNRDEFGAKK